MRFSVGKNININKKVISIVILGVGACLLSSLLNLYFSTKNQDNQRLLYEIQQLTGKAENLRLMSKNFIQNGAPDIWKQITHTIESLHFNLADVSPAGKEWKQKFAVIHEGIKDYHHLLTRIHHPALLLNKEKSRFQRIGLSFSMEVKDRIIIPYKKEEGLTIYRGKAFDPVKIRIKETAYDLMALHIQQQLILTELLLDWDLAGYHQKKKLIAGTMKRHKTQLNYLNILMGSDPDIDNVIRSLKKKLADLVQYEQKIVETFTELDGINRELTATGSRLVNDCADFSTEILSDISHDVKLNRSLNWSLLIFILCVLGLLGAVLARDIIHIVRDLEKSREQYRNSEKTIKAVTDNVPGVVFQLKSGKDHAYAVDFVSTKANEIFGLKPDLANLFDQFSHRIPEDEKERYFRSVREAFEKIEPWIYEGRFIKPDGKEIWFSGNSIPRREGDAILFNGLLMDITRRKEMESSMRLSKFIFDRAPMGIWRTGREGDVLDVNEEGCASLGYSREELCRMKVFDFDPDFDIKDWTEVIAALKKAGTITFETMHRRRNGEIFPIQVISNLMQFEGQEYAITFVQDITERKRDEEELNRLRNYLSNIIDSMPSVLVGVDSKGTVTQWNHRAEQLTGISSEKAFSQPLDKVFPGLTHEIDRIRTSIRERRVLRDSKVPRRDREGTRYEDITIFPLMANGVEGAVIRVDDITDQVRMEEMMIQSEKMLSVGGLAAGMAHEINNPLAGMVQTAQVMARRLKAGANIPANQKAAEAAGITMASIEQFMEARGIPRMIEAISLSGQRVSDIVNNMLSFARKDDAAVSSHYLEEILDKTIELAATDYDLKKAYDFKRIKIIREYNDNPPVVPCQASKIQQVLLNVLTNGAQAMQGAGIPNATFIIRTYVDSARHMACMEIEDNGPGMDEATSRQIFDPFFTTKPVGVGTGLGLSVSYFIITENHKGKMTVESSPGAGAKFIIRLPLLTDRHET